MKQAPQCSLLLLFHLIVLVTAAENIRTSFRGSRALGDLQPVTATNMVTYGISATEQQLWSHMSERYGWRLPAHLGVMAERQEQTWFYEAASSIICTTVDSRCFSAWLGKAQPTASPMLPSAVARTALPHLLHTPDACIVLHANAHQNLNGMTIDNYCQARPRESLACPCEIAQCPNHTDTP